MSYDTTFIGQSLQGEVLAFAEIDSTNEFLLKNHNTLPTGSLCLAETQTAGRGRRGRKWFSPNSQNLYFSMLWRYSTEEIQAEKLPRLSLVCAILLAELLSENHVPNVQIKWPNDLYFQGKKAGGILIETVKTATHWTLVIGIGLNLAMEKVDESIVTQQWAGLGQFQLDRNIIAQQLAEKLQQALIDFPTCHFSNYCDRWQRFDYFYQKPVTLLQEKESWQGIAQGINARGELLLQTSSKIYPFAIGETSLRAG